MSETKWTKGPWRAEVKPHVLIHNVYGRKHPDGGDYAPLFSTTDEANAHLIAAAPRLYDELFRALAAIRNPEAFEIEQVATDIEAALRQARGEQ